MRTTIKYTLENDLVDTANNRQILAEIYGLDSSATAVAVGEHMIANKAESMLQLCDAMLHKENPKAIELPKHIQEVIDFIK